MKHTNLICKTFVIYFIFIFSSLNSNINAMTILIDPGHGGDDFGAKKISSNAKEKSYYEKDLTLSISLKVRDLLKKKSYSVFLTRSVDRTITLEERATMCEKVKADLFISIHVNSDLKKVSHGVESYYLDNHQDIAVKKLEDVENKNLNGEELIINQILTDLVIERSVQSSKSLANFLHKNIMANVKEFKMKDRGVRPGLFYVLALSKRPSALLEIGFLSNTDDRNKITGDKFKDRYAKGIVDGIISYIGTNKKKTE